MSLTVEAVQAQEDACVLPTFDADVAWALGSLIRAHCRQHHARPVVVYVAHARSQQTLFCAASKPGTQPDNMHWVRRKEAVVLRWGVSTMRLRLQLQAQAQAQAQAQVPPEALGDTQALLKSKFEVADPSVYACHGGGFPVRVKGVEGVVGVIVVSGLKQEDDHAVIVEGIRQYLANQTA